MIAAYYVIKVYFKPILTIFLIILLHASDYIRIVLAQMAVLYMTKMLI